MPEIIVTGLRASAGLASGEIAELAGGGAGESQRTAHGTPRSPTKWPVIRNPATTISGRASPTSTTCASAFSPA